jgi:hypothetical protein
MGWLGDKVKGIKNWASGEQPVDIKPEVKSEIDIINTQQIEPDSNILNVNENLAPDYITDQIIDIPEPVV